VREKLIGYIQKNHPECLPRYRGEVEATTGDGVEANRKDGPKGSVDQGIISQIPAP